MGLKEKLPHVIFGIMVFGGLVLFGGVSVSAMDVAFQAGGYVVLFDASNENNIFADAGYGRTGYHINPIETVESGNERSTMIIFVREEFDRTYSTIEPLTYDIKDYSSVVVGILEFDSEDNLMANLDNTTEKFELSRDIRPAGRDGKIGLIDNNYIASYPLDNRTLCHVVYLPLERNRATAVNDLEGFVDSLVVLKMDLRSKVTEKL